MLCQRNSANWRSVLEERISVDKCAVLRFGRESQWHKHRVWSWGGRCSSALPEAWSLQELDTHLQSHAIAEKAVKTASIQRKRTAGLVKYLFAPLYLLYSVHFWALLFKKKMNLLQAFKKTPNNRNYEIWKTSPTRTEKNGVFIPKK